MSGEGVVGEADEVCPHSDEGEKDGQMDGEEDSQKDNVVMESTSASCESTSQATQLQTADAQVREHTVPSHYSICVHLITATFMINFTSTCVQCSTADSIKQDMMRYEKITLEAAAQVRQKWKDV